MEVLLIKAPRGRYSYFREGSESLALGYLAAFLRWHGHFVAILDGQLEGLSVEDAFARCCNEGLVLIGFTVADPSFIPATFRLAEAVRATRPEVHLTIGGYAPTFHYQEVLTQCQALDSVVRYEGEATLLELVQCLEDKRDWRQVQGIAFRRGDVVVCNEPRPLIADLDLLPLPARDYVPFIQRHLPEIGVISLAGSRGCYANCGFCSIRQFYGGPPGPPYRLRSVKNVVDEIESLVRDHGVEEFLLIDDVFTLPGNAGDKRVAEWREKVSKRGLRVMLSISDRADQIRRPRYDELYRIGVRQIMMGVEATDPRILAYFNKGVTLDEIRAAFGVLRDLAIDVTITFINFTPKTTLEILEENLECLLSLDVNFLLGLLNRLQVYVGTPIADDMIKQGLVTGTFPDFSYRIPDERVEVAYEACRRCLSPFLEISYEIMKLERRFRVKQFRLEREGTDLRALLEGREWFKTTCRTIMREAADVFRGILNYASKECSLSDHFVEETRERASKRYEAWHRTLLLIGGYAPLFQGGDGALLLPRQEIRR